MTARATKNSGPVQITAGLTHLEKVIWGVVASSGDDDLVAKFKGSAEVASAAAEFASTLDNLWMRHVGMAVGPLVHADVPDLSDPLRQTAPQTAVPATKASGPELKCPDAAKRPNLDGAPSTNETREAEQLGPLPFHETKDQAVVETRRASLKPGTTLSKVRFTLANAKAGLAYESTLTSAELDGQPRFRAGRVANEVCLMFDEQSGVLKGGPTLAGEHDVSFEWSLDGVEWHAGKSKVLVNPDPRSLWKVLEPPTDAPYRKPHTNGQSIDCGEFRISVGSRRGRSHEHSGSFRDDDFWISHDAHSGWSVIIVCDGAGSAKSSRWGSKLAAETGGRYLTSELSGGAGKAIEAGLESWDAEASKASVGVEFHNAFYEMAKLCVSAIEAEAAAQSASPRDYATTMLVVTVRKQGDDTFLASFWMGDGAIGVYGPAGKIRLMGSPDGGEFVGQTRFLDRAALKDQGFSKRVSIGRYPGVIAVLAMTDGVSDPWFETDNGMLEAARWGKLWDEVQPLLAREKPHGALVEWMDFFTSGHHDDRTLAVLW